MKYMIVCGIYLGFHRRSKHTYLKAVNIVQGTFDNGHQEYEGHAYIETNHSTNKSHKITLKNPIKWKINGVMRLSIHAIDDLTDPGRTLKDITINM